MNIDKVHLRHCMLLYFHRGKTAAETTKILCEAYGNNVVSERTCRGWFVRFRNGDFDVSDRLRSGRPETIKDDRLQALLDKNSAQTQEELADQLGVTQVAVSKRLHAMGKVKKKGNWISHQLIEKNCVRFSNIPPSSLTRPLKESSSKEFYQKNIGFGSRCRHNIVPKLRKNRRIYNKWGVQYHVAVHDAVFGRQCLPYMPTEPPASLSEEIAESDPLYVCKQCKDCFRFQSSFEDHNNRHSWILGLWCTNCFITVCTHVVEKTSACPICRKKENEKRSYLRKRGLTKNQKVGAVKVFYNQCQLFEHLKLHGLSSVNMGHLMLMPLPTDISDSDWSPELEITCEALMEHTFLSRMHIVDWLKINKMEDNWWKIVNNTKNDVNLINKVVSGYEGRKLFKTFENLPVDRLTYVSSHIRRINKSSSDIPFVNTDIKNKNKKRHLYNTVSDRSISENEDNPCTSTDIAFIDCGPTLNCFESELSQGYAPNKQAIMKSTQNIQSLTDAVKANNRKKVAILKNLDICKVNMIRENVTVKSNEKTNNTVNQSLKGSIHQQQVAQLSIRKNASNITNKSTVKTGINKTLNNVIQIDVPSPVKKVKLHETTSDYLEQDIQTSKANCNSKILTIQGPKNVNITSIISQLSPHLISNKKLVFIGKGTDSALTCSKNKITNEKELVRSNVSDNSNKEANIALRKNVLKNDPITIKKQQVSGKIVIKNGKKYLMKHSGNMTRSSKNSSVISNKSKTIEQITPEHNISGPVSTVFNEGENVHVDQTALSHNGISCLTPSPSPSELSNSSSCESQVKQTLITSALRKVPPNLISICPSQRKCLIETISLITKKDGYVYMNAKLSDCKIKEDSQDMRDVITKYRQEMINDFYQLNSFELQKRIHYLQHVSEEMREVMNFLSDNVFKEKLRFISNLQRILEKCFHKCNQNIRDEKDDDILLNEWKLQYKTTDVPCPSCDKIMKPKSYIAGFSKLSKVDNVYCSCYKHVCHKCLVYQGSLSRFIMHQNFHKKSKPFICPDCRCKFISAKFLEVHTWTVCFHILKSHILACKICEIDGFRDMESITRHFAVMHSDTKIACEDCFRVLSSYAEYIKHYTETHSPVLEQNPIRLAICRLGGDIIRFENYMSYLKRCPAIRKLTWYKCPFCSLVILEKSQLAMLNAHLRDHHLHRLSEVISREALIDIFGEECLGASINVTSENSMNAFVNINDASHEIDTVVPTIVSTETIASEIFECSSQDIWTRNSDDLVSSIGTSVSSEVIKGVGSEETDLIQKVFVAGSVTNSEPTKSLTSMSKILTKMDKKFDVSQSDIVQNAIVKNDLSHKDMERTKIDRVKFDKSKQKTKEKKESDKCNNNSTALHISESERLECEIKNELSFESPTKCSKSESPSKADTDVSVRIKVVDINKICKTNICNPFLSEPLDTQLEHENESCTTSILKPPPLAKIPQHLLEFNKTKVPQNGLKNAVKSKKKSSRNVTVKPKLRIAINEPTNIQEKYVNYLCHLCGEKINTSQSVLRLHFLEKHSSEYKLMTISPRLLRLSSDFINGGYKQVLNSKKRKSDSILSTSKRKRRWTPKKQVDINLSGAGLCVEQETAEDGEGNFKCKKCGQRCIDMSNLREHIAANHRLKDRYLICLECGENFVVEPSLQMHLKAFHGIENPTSYMTQNPLYAPDINSDVETEGRTTVANQCYVCMAVFEDKAAVDKHLRVHGMAFLNRKRIEAKNALKSPEKNAQEIKQICVKNNSRESVKCSKPAETILEKLNAAK